MRNNLVIILITAVLTFLITILVIFKMKSAEAEIIAGQEQVQSPGVIEIYSGSNIPSGYLLCDGRAVSRTEYSTLFDIIGTTYGSGDGSTTFNLPNFQGKTAVGKNTGTFNTLGKAVGSESTTLQTANLPKHTHSIPSLSGSTNSTGQHTHSWKGWTKINVGSDYYAAIFGTDSAQSYINQGKGPQAAGSHSHTVTTNASVTGNAGTGNSFTNIQPSLTVNYIIKY